VGHPQWGSQRKGQTVALGRGRPWGAEGFAAGSGLCNAVLGREGVRPCSRPQQLGQSAGFGTESPKPADVGDRSHQTIQGRGREGSVMKERRPGG